MYDAGGPHGSRKTPGVPMRAGLKAFDSLHKGTYQVPHSVARPSREMTKIVSIARVTVVFCVGVICEGYQNTRSFQLRMHPNL